VRCGAVAAAVVALSVAGCASSPSGWRTYRQPPGPMQLSFRYPAAWHVSGTTFVATGGLVGSASLADGTNATLQQLSAPGACPRKGTLVGHDGIYVTWSEYLSVPSTITLGSFPGKTLRVAGRPARWLGPGGPRCGQAGTITGVIQMSRRDFLSMNALVGNDVPTSEVRDLMAIFDSVRP
jgi:hypothetical protein